MVQPLRESPFKANRVVAYGPEVGSGNVFRTCMKSGLLTLVAAKTDTAGHIAALRWGNSSHLCLIQSLKAHLWVTTAPTAAQELGLELYVARGYSASHSGGTAATLTTTNAVKRSLNKDGVSLPASLMTDLRMGTTGALTAGTHTLDTQPIAAVGVSQLAAAATVQNGRVTLEYTPAPGVGPLVLGTNEGLVLANSILGGTAGVWRVALEIDWREVDDTAQ